MEAIQKKIVDHHHRRLILRMSDILFRTGKFVADWFHTYKKVKNLFTFKSGSVLISKVVFIYDD